MKKREKAIVLFLAGLLATSGISARTLTLQQAIDTALRTHPDIKASLLQLQSSEEDVVIERSAYLPSLSLHADYNPQQTFTSSQMGKFHTLNESGWSAGVAVKEQLFDFGRTSHRLAAARTQKEIAALNTEEAKALMRYQVRMAYSLALAQKLALKARRKDLEAKHALYLQTKALVRQGLRTPADESRFLSAMRQAEDALAQARSAYEQAIYTLESYVGRPISTSIHLEMKALDAVWHSAELPHYRSVEANNLRMRIARSGEQASEEQYLATKYQRFGTVDLVADASHYDALNRYNTTLVGVQYSALLYSGGSIDAQSQKARIARMIAREHTDTERLTLRKQFKSLLAQLRESSIRIKARKAEIVSAEETRRMTQARYSQGLATYVEVLDAEAVRLESELGLIEARYNRAATLYQLEYLNAH